MVFDEIFTDLSGREKVLGIIVSAVITAFLSFFLNIGTFLSIFLFFVLMVISWLSLSANDETVKGD